MRFSFVPTLLATLLACSSPSDRPVPVPSSASTSPESRATDEAALASAVIVPGNGIGCDFSPFLSSPPVPAIDATVTATRDEVLPMLILLSVGSAQGAEKGFHFSVYRGSNFIGKVVVEKVLDRASGCRVLFTKAGETIKVGDAAATRLQ